MSKNTILVIGGGGYIGSACVSKLIAENYKAVVLDNFSTGQSDKVSKEAICIHGDILDTKKLESIFSKYSFDTVFHFAAKKSVAESEANPTLYFQNNVTGTTNILAMMEKYQVPHLIFSSTAAVYEPVAATGKPFTEESPTKPINVYGLSKLMAEQIIQNYERLGKIKQYSILRYFNVAGDIGLQFKENNAQNVFPLLAEALTHRKTFKIFGTDYKTPDGTCIRDYIHLDDLIDGHLLLLQKSVNESGIYNLGTNTGYSVRDLIKGFERVSGQTLKIAESEKRAGDPAMTLADATKAQNKLGWEPKRTLDDMVRSCLETYS